MNISLFTSAFFSLFAFGAAIVLLLRYRNWRYGFFASATAVAAALLVGRYTATLFTNGWEWNLTANRSDFIGVTLSVLALFAVVFLERLINRQLKAEQALELPRYSVDQAAISAFWVDPDGTIVDANECACAYLGFRKRDLLNRKIYSVDSSLAEALWPEHWNTLKASRSLTYESQFRTCAGDNLAVDVSVTYLDFDGREYCVAFARDITERKRQEEALEYQASHDPLTELPNRTKFTRNLIEEIDEAAHRETMVAVFMLDLDRFKEVNDTLGHSVGDHLLQELANRLALQMPERVTFARFGGDEFALLMPNVTNLTEMENFANYVISEIRNPFGMDDIVLEVGGSIGAAIYPQHGETPEELLQHADIAMYTAKRDHLGFAVYCPDSDPHNLRNLTLTGDLRRAIESDELELAFQPKVDLRKGQVIGVEALARWPREDQGYVPPEEFINHAEQSGLILPLTKWVLNASLERASAWRRAGREIEIAVNLSARLLHHAAIIPTVATMLREWDYPADQLTLEVTENAILVDPEHAMEMVRQFDELGVKVSIDDFGMGYSSLAYLKTLDARELKIDKSFVQCIEDDPSDRTIVRSVVSLAHELGLKVVAEGIESMRALEILVGFRCDVGQGFLFSEPMAAHAFERWFDAHNPQGQTKSRTKRRASARKTAETKLAA
ncbi:MAG: EAL domain-containing protein [Alphaproteobacteria bacterium]|nr:EAL domain-containing protein [Alphaproteobacteria bacterium]